MNGETLERDSHLQVRQVWGEKEGGNLLTPPLFFTFFSTF